MADTDTSGTTSRTSHQFDTQSDAQDFMAHYMGMGLPKVANARYQQGVSLHNVDGKYFVTLNY